MYDYFDKLNEIIEEELSERRKIAIFPMGKVGTFAKYILENRFGQKGIYIDNNLKRYNREMVGLEELENIKLQDITLIICFDDYKTNAEYMNNIAHKFETIRIRSCKEYSIHLLPGAKHTIEMVRNTIKVKGVRSHQLVRVGGANDGAYVMLDDLSKQDKAYSFGIGDNVEWDEAVAHRGINVLCFDPYIDRLPSMNERLFFRKAGIGKKNNSSYSLFSMEEILKRENDENCDNLILKMDVEGAEWDFLEDVSVDTLNQFRQMTFEFHELFSADKFNKIKQALEKLNYTHHPVWIHGNNVGGVTRDDGNEMPNLLEITYARKSSYDFFDVSYDAPTAIDMPNLTTFIDIPLKKWGSKE